MAEISRLSRLLNGVVRGVDLSTNTLVVQDLKLDGVLLSETLADYLAAIEAAQEDATQALADAAAAQDDADDLITLSGVAANATHLGTFTGVTIPDSATVKGALQSLETALEAMPDPMEYKGNWAASTNTPTLADGVGNNGDVYYVTDAGTVNFGSGNITFAQGDRVVYSGTDGEWQKWDTTDQVTSVNGQTGAVSLDTDDVAEGSTNKYYTATQARSDIIAATITNGDTTHAPSGDAVFDALANKSNVGHTHTAADITDFSSAFDSEFAGKTTDDLTEGSTNLYFTPERAQAAVSNTGKLQRDFVAGESMAANTSFAVRFALTGETAGRVYKADNDASSTNKFYAIGIALKTSAVSAGDPVTVIMEGEYTQGSSDTPFASGDVGKPVYVGAAGALTITPPTTTDLAAYRVGVVMTTTKIWVGDKQLNGIN